MKRRKIHDLGTFHKEASRHGLTYAQAQIEETCDKIGSVRAPSDPEEGVVFNKVSTWNMLRKLVGSN